MGLNFREELKKNGIVLLGEDTQKERTIHYIYRTIIAISVKMADSNNL